MIGLLVTVFGLALVDSLNPSAIAVTLYLLTQRSRTLKVTVYMVAVFLSYFVIGVLLMLGFDSIWGYFDGPVAYAVQGVAGALMLLYGILAPSENAGKKTARVPRSQSLGAVFLLGLTISVVEFSTALPYLGAIAILTRADLAVVQWLPVLVAYNLVFVSPPFLLLGAYQLFGSRLGTVLQRWGDKFRGSSRTTLLWIVGIVGFLLLADSLRFFDFFGLVELLDGWER